MGAAAARRVDGIPVTRHWLIPQAQRPKVYIEHPVMSADEIRAAHAGRVGPVLLASRASGSGRAW